MSNRPWTCPFCNRDAVFRSGDEQVFISEFLHPLKNPNERKAVVVHLEFCPNEKCTRTAVTAKLFSMRPSGPNKWRLHGSPEYEWKLLPESSAKEFPDYIPNVILSDYREACRIASLSPKASATLARRCLQGMIRDFWGISKNRLKDEVDALEGKVAPETWDAIDSVRKIGNIGAHMEADINVIVDVDSGEAELLIDLIETLLSDWYVARHNREERMAKVKALAEEKQKQRDSNSSATETDGRPASS